MFHSTSHIFFFIYMIWGSTLSHLRIWFIHCGCSEGKNTFTSSKHAAFLSYFSRTSFQQKTHQISKQNTKIVDGLCYRIRELGKGIYGMRLHYTKSVWHWWSGKIDLLKTAEHQRNDIYTFTHARVWTWWEARVKHFYHSLFYLISITFIIGSCPHLYNIISLYIRLFTHYEVHLPKVETENSRPQTTFQHSI